MKIFCYTKKVILFSLIFLGSNVWAAELNNVTLPDAAKVNDKSLTLNGMALRTVYKWGIPVKVYVAGLYLEAKNNDSDVLLKNDEVKQLVMHFVRPLDRDTIIEKFREGFVDSCFSNCDKKGEQFSHFAKAVVSVRKDNKITLTFFKDKMEIDSTGPNAKKEMIADADLSRNMLAMFINKLKSPGKELRTGLLGLK